MYLMSETKVWRREPTAGKIEPDPIKNVEGLWNDGCLLQDGNDARSERRREHGRHQREFHSVMTSFLELSSERPSLTFRRVSISLNQALAMTFSVP